MNQAEPFLFEGGEGAGRAEKKKVCGDLFNPIVSFLGLIPGT